jgi:hypothetical protein
LHISTHPCDRIFKGNGGEEMEVSMDEKTILELFIAFKDDLVPKEKRTPEGIKEAFERFSEVFKQKTEVHSESLERLKNLPRPKNQTDKLFRNY